MGDNCSFILCVLCYFIFRWEIAFGLFDVIAHAMWLLRLATGLCLHTAQVMNLNNLHTMLTDKMMSSL